MKLLILLAAFVFGAQLSFAQSSTAPAFMKITTDKTTYSNGDQAFVSIATPTQPTNKALEYYLKATFNSGPQKVTVASASQAFLITNPMSASDTNVIEVKLYLQDKKFVKDTLVAIVGYKQRNAEIDERLATETDTAIRNSLIQQKARNNGFIAQAETNLLNHRTLLETKSLTLTVQTLSKRTVANPVIQIVPSRPDSVYLTGEAGSFTVNILSDLNLPDGKAEFVVEGKVSDCLPCSTAARSVINARSFAFTTQVFNIDNVGDRNFETKVFYRSKAQSDSLRQAITAVIAQQNDYIAKRNATSDVAEKEYYNLLIAELDTAKTKYTAQLQSLLQPLGTPILTPFQVHVSSYEEYGVEVSGNQLVEITEGASYQFSVVLKGQPVGAVNVVVDTDELMGFGAANFVPGEPISLQFNSANWNVPQTVTIKALDDQIARGLNYHVPASFSVSSSDTRYLGYQVSPLDFLVSDNDSGTLVFSPSSDLNEGASGTYSVKLNSQPQGTVTISIYPDRPASVSPTTLTFDSSDWNVYKAVSISTPQDLVAEGENYFVNYTHELTSTDPIYDGQALNYSVKIIDDDVAGYSIVESDGNTTATEGGVGDSLAIQLTSQPSVNVVVHFDTGSQIQQIPGLVFTPTNWNIPQIVLVAAVDDSTYEGAHVGHILIESAGGEYGDVQGRVIDVGITDNDTAPAFTKVAAGANSACGLRGDAVYCWGNNDVGQLGVGDTTTRLIATIVPSLSSDVISIAGKVSTMCAIKNGGAYCWGQNSGQLGNGSSNAFEASPVAVLGLGSGVSKISAGTIHTCAIQNGQVYCWGVSSHGRLGIGFPSSGVYTTPQAVSLPEDAKDISVGDWRSCALTVGGKIFCWGNNNLGQIGNGIAGGEYYTPQLVSDIASGATAVAASEQFTCAIVNSGVKCWGANYNGQLGIGYDGGNLTTPQDVVGLSSDVTAIENNYGSTTCAIQNGIAKCWGAGVNGSLGNGATSNSNTAVNVVGFNGAVTDISFGSLYGCGIEQGQIKCWGTDWGGNLGNGNTGDQLTAQPITDPSPNIKHKKR